MCAQEGTKALNTLEREQNNYWLSGEEGGAIYRSRSGHISAMGAYDASPPASSFPITVADSSATAVMLGLFRADSPPFPP